MSAQAATLSDRAFVVAMGVELSAAARRKVPPADVEDVVQETWAAALAGVDRFEGRASLAAWLRSILRRKIADRYRRQRDHVPLERSVIASDASGLAHRQVEAKSLLTRVQSATERLSDQERAVLRLCVAEDLDREVVAQRLGISRLGVRVALSRGRRRLRQELEEVG